MNFGLVLMLSVIYAWWVKDRVEVFADPIISTTDESEDEGQPLFRISQAASDSIAYIRIIAVILFS